MDHSQRERVRTAYHEAGHAVLGYYFIGPSHIDRVELLPLDIDNEHAGHCQASRCFDPRRTGWMALAGRAAELMYLDRARVPRTGLDRLGLIRDGLRGDFECAYRALVDEGGPSNYLYEDDIPVNDLGLRLLQRERRRVRTVLAKLWPRVEAVAQALLQNGALDGERLADILFPFLWPTPPRFMWPDDVDYSDVVDLVSPGTQRSRAPSAPS